MHEGTVWVPAIREYSGCGWVQLGRLATIALLNDHTQIKSDIQLQACRVSVLSTMQSSAMDLPCIALAKGSSCAAVGQLCDKQLLLLPDLDQ